MDEDNIPESLTKDGLEFVGFFTHSINKWGNEFMDNFPMKGISYQDSSIEQLLTKASEHMDKIKDVYKVLNEIYHNPERYNKFSMLPDETKKEIEARMTDITNYLMMAWTKIK